MKVDEELIKKIADLSKLNLNEQETKKFTNDFNEILSAFKILDEIDVHNIKSSFRPVEERNTLREDCVRPSISQKDSLKFTKNKQDGFFIGPKTVDK